MECRPLTVVFCNLRLEVCGQTVGGGPAAAEGGENNLTVAAALLPVQPRHHLIVAAQLHIPPALADHQPHQRVEPVGGGSQEQEGLIWNITAAAVA